MMLTLLIKKYCSLVFFLLLMSAATSRLYACAQISKPQIISFSAFLEMCENQPDFTADWLILISEPAFGIKSINRIKIARKQGQSRREVFPLENETSLKNKADRDYKIILIDRPGQLPIALNPQRKTYTQTPATFNAAAFDIDSFIKSKSREFGDIKVEGVSNVVFAGHQTTRIRLTFADEAGQVFFYFAKDLNNLIIGMDTGKPEESSLTVSNISFDVPDDLFQIPRGFEKVDFTAFLETMRQKAGGSRSANSKTLPAGIVEAIPVAPSPPAAALPSSGEVIITTGIDSEPVLLNRPEANYTEEARANKVQGIITVTLLIGVDGMVKQVRLLSGLPDGLNEEAVKAAYKRRYKPAMKKGEPVPCWIRTKIEFRLDQK
jgi:TonB family protein